MPKIKTSENAPVSQLVHCELPTSHLSKLDRLAKRQNRSRTSLVKEWLSSVSPSDLGGWKSKLPQSKKSVNTLIHFRVDAKIARKLKRLSSQDDRSIRGWMRRCLMYSIEEAYSK